MVKGDAAALLALSCVIAGCGSAPVSRAEEPPGHPVEVDVEDVPVKGSAITVHCDDATYTGELLAADARELVLRSDERVFAVPASTVRSAQIALYSNGGLVAFLSITGAAGTVSALTHGVLFIVSGPAWAILSTAAVTSAAADPNRVVSVRGNSLALLFQYARFPQGLPSAYAVKASGR